jgi:hypothetical protein
MKKTYRALISVPSSSPRGLPAEPGPLYSRQRAGHPRQPR